MALQVEIDYRVRQGAIGLLIQSVYNPPWSFVIAH
jgi:hypothetical protein